jgi:hypothetical protein
MTATARRGHGEGSVDRDAANGTWVGAISLGWRPDGSRIRRKVTGRTKTEVREKLKKLRGAQLEDLELRQRPFRRRRCRRQRALSTLRSLNPASSGVRVRAIASWSRAVSAETPPGGCSVVMFFLLAGHCGQVM